MRWQHGAGLAAVVLVAAFLTHLPALRHDPWNSDEAYVATEAQVINRGGALYVDATDRKPPILPVLYALTFRATGSDDLTGIRVLTILAYAASAALLASEARRRFRDPRAGLAAALLFLGVAAAFAPGDGQTASFEAFVLPPAIAAVLLVIRRRPVAAGVALGVAVLVLQSAAVMLIPLLWIVTRPRGPRRRSVTALLAGAAAPVALAAALFGPDHLLRWVVTSNDTYLDAAGALGYVLGLGARRTSTFLLATTVPVVLAAWAWRTRREDAELWLWLAAAVIAVSSGLRFFGHYYLQLLPPLCLLATRSLLRLSRRAAVVAAVVVVGSAAWYVVPALWARRSEPVAVADRLAAYTRTRTRPGARILVWGHLPEVYWWSGRLPATRFPTTGFLTGHTGGRPPDRVGTDYAVAGAWRDFDADLRAHPPELVFDLAPGDVRNAAYFSPNRFPRFQRFLTTGYRPVGSVAGVLVYARA